MKIVNLTGRPQWLPTAIEELCCNKLDKHDYPNFNFLFRRFRNELWHENEKVMLNECPVFLVETYKSRVFNKTEKGDIAVLVPAPMSEKAVAMQVTEDSQEAGMIFEDYLGVYIYKPGAVLEHSIFIWVDRIQDVAQQDPKNSQALTLQVILHEYAHFLMNPASYGDTVGSAYSNQKWECKYVEEACANAFSLAICYDSMTQTQQAFIESFIKSQPQNYAAGWWDFSDGFAGQSFNIWMQIKVLMDDITYQKLSSQVDWMAKEAEQYHMSLYGVIINKNLYCTAPGTSTGSELHKFVMFLTRKEKIYSDDGIHWGIMNRDSVPITKPIFEEIETAGNIDDERIYAVKRNGKFAVITIDKVLTGFIYDGVWSFHNDGYCQVAVDIDGKRKYGFIDADGHEAIRVIWDHLYSFNDSEVTPAKLDGVYHIIDKSGNIVVHNLPFTDVRAFVNSYAFVKDKNNKWGLIDTCGNIAVELKYDKLNDIPEPCTQTNQTC